jgi:hypothetical protein
VGRERVVSTPFSRFYIGRRQQQPLKNYGAMSDNVQSSVKSEGALRWEKMEEPFPSRCFINWREQKGRVGFIRSSISRSQRSLKTSLASM